MFNPSLMFRETGRLKARASNMTEGLFYLRVLKIDENSKDWIYETINEIKDSKYKYKIQLGDSILKY
jgi:hypothetical protein